MAQDEAQRRIAAPASRDSSGAAVAEGDGPSTTKAGAAEDGSPSPGSTGASSAATVPPDASGAAVAERTGSAGAGLAAAASPGATDPAVVKGGGTGTGPSRQLAKEGSDPVAPPRKLQRGDDVPASGGLAADAGGQEAEAVAQTKGSEGECAPRPIARPLLNAAAEIDDGHGVGIETQGALTGELLPGVHFCHGRPPYPPLAPASW